MKRKKTETAEAAARKRLMDERAASLRLQVEEIARRHSSMGATASGRTADSNDGAPAARSEVGRSEPTMPLLITSTDMGVYIKWALTLQEQLAHTTEHYRQARMLLCELQEENATLRAALSSQNALGSQLNMASSWGSSSLNTASGPVRGPRGTAEEISAPAPAPAASLQSIRVDATPLTGASLHGDALDPRQREADLARQQGVISNEGTVDCQQLAIEPQGEQQLVDYEQQQHADHEQQHAARRTTSCGSQSIEEQDSLLDALLSTPILEKVSTPNLELLARQLDASATAASPWSREARITNESSVSLP